MKISNSTACEPLTKEQIKKRDVRQEDVDIRGVVKRHRVRDQNVWDIMFLHEFIDQPQHEAVNLFMEDLSRSGAFPVGSVWDREPRETSQSARNSQAERRMAFSGAFRSMTRESGDEEANMVVSMFSSNYLYLKDKSKLKELSGFLGEALWSLARYYKTTGGRDPRRLLRKQVGIRREKHREVGEYGKRNGASSG